MGRGRLEYDTGHQRAVDEYQSVSPVMLARIHRYYGACTRINGSPV